MAKPSTQPHDIDREEPADLVIATTARWLGFPEDLALGCECADPSLQIEDWPAHPAGLLAHP
jgi:hypothetical protein